MKQLLYSLFCCFKTEITILDWVNIDGQELDYLLCRSPNYISIVIASTCILTAPTHNYNLHATHPKPISRWRFNIWEHSFSTHRTTYPLDMILFNHSSVSFSTKMTEIHLMTHLTVTQILLHHITTTQWILARVAVSRPV